MTSTLAELEELKQIPKVGNVAAEKLKVAGYTVFKLSHAEPSKIAEILGCSVAAAKEIIANALEKVVAKTGELPKPMTANEYKAFLDKRIEYYTTGSKRVDELLGGGLASSSIVGLSGPQETGKTQIVLTAMADCVCNKGKHAYFIETELGTFHPDRLEEIAKARGWADKYDPDKVLVFSSYQIKNVETQFHYYEVIYDMAKENNWYGGVLGIDSFNASFMRKFQGRELFPTRKQEFGRHYTTLEDIAKELNLLILLTFQVMEIPVSVEESKGMQMDSMLARAEFGCYSDDTEVLTEDGWMLMKDVVAKEMQLKVATLNERGCLTYQYPSRYFKYYYEGSMFHQTGRNIDLLVTPNHNLYVARDRRRRNPRRGSFTLVEAGRIPRHVYYKKDAEWEGKEEESFTLPAVLHHHIKRRPSRTIPMELWLKFLGIYLAEGSLSSGKGNRYRVSIANQTPAVMRFIEGVLEGLGLRYSYHGHSYCFSNKQFYSYLKQFGKSHDKYIPKEFKQLSKPLLQILLDALIKGDGHVSSSGTIRYTTVSKRLADDVQEIAIKLGYTATVRRGEGHILYVTIANRHKTPLLNKKKDNRQRVPYKAFVYCLEVPSSSHTLLVRRNGKTCWCGNSPYLPWGGHGARHPPATWISLEKTRSKTIWKAHLFGSSRQPLGETFFRITEKGVDDLPETLLAKMKGKESKNEG